jgi:hypothetical protein
MNNVKMKLLLPLISFEKKKEKKRNNDYISEITSMVVMFS